MQVAKLFELPIRESPDQLFGIECEIEALDTRVNWDISDDWGVHEDNSLRNNGREFVTRPLTLKQTLEAFRQLHEGLRFTDPEKAYSSRTSIHVHMNCLNLEDHQVKRIVLFYALFEEAFFQLVAPARRDNIHCVALVETFLPTFYGLSLKGMVSRWSKYTALNLLPLSVYGTLEFRHMHGHNDLEGLSAWLGVLERLFTLGKTTSLDEKTLTQDNMSAWFGFIFGQHPMYKELYPQLVKLTRNSVIDVKMGL